MDIYALIAITELSFDDFPEDDLALSDDCIVTVGKARVLSLIDFPLFRNQVPLRALIGELERDTLANASALVMVPQVSEEDITNESAQRFLQLVAANTQLFLLGLWLVKDNSGNAGSGFVALGVPTLGITAIYKENAGALNFNADCTRAPTRVSRIELDRAVRYFHQLWDIIPQVEWRHDLPRPSALIYESRLFRAVHFIQAARDSQDVALRALYVSMSFEALLAAESGHYSHNVPKRASLMLGKSKRERQAPYMDIYELYRFRNDVAHGANFDPAKLTDLRDRTRRADQYLRTLIAAILDDPVLLKLFRHGSNKDLNSYFDDKKDELPDRLPCPQCGR